MKQKSCCGLLHLISWPVPKWVSLSQFFIGIGSHVCFFPFETIYVKICCFFHIRLAFGKPQEYVNRLNFTTNGEIYLGFRILWVRAFISSNNMWTLIKNVELFRYISVFNTTGFVPCQMMYYWSFLKFGFSIIFIEKISDSPRG